MVIGNRSCAWHLGLKTNWNQISHDWKQRNCTGVFGKAELTRDGQRAARIAVVNERGYALIDYVDLLCLRACVESDPSKVGIAVCGILLQSNFTPCGQIGRVNCVAVAVPSASRESRNFTRRQSSETSHRYEGSIEF